MKNNYETEIRFMSGNRWKPHQKIAVVCPKCGLNSWRFKNGVVLTSMPPQYKDEYECSGCGHPHTVINKGEEFPAPVELFEEVE